MVYLMIRHKVRDYMRWKPAFDAHAAARADFGCTGGSLFRSHNDVNDVTVMLNFNSIGAAENFVASTELRNAMHASGVVGDPQIQFLDEVATLEA
jgi:hypothetical protein